MEISKLALLERIKELEEQVDFWKKSHLDLSWRVVALEKSQPVKFRKPKV